MEGYMKFEYTIPVAGDGVSLTRAGMTLLQRVNMTTAQEALKKIYLKALCEYVEEDELRPVGGIKG